MQILPSLSSKNIRDMRPEFVRPEPGHAPLGVEREVEAVDKLGNVTDVLTIFLRGSECSYHCLMCDLWKYTHRGATPPGAIPAQIEEALSGLNGARPTWLKLYNASNFFSPIHVPTEDLPAIAAAAAGFERVIVENHPRLLNASISEFQHRLQGDLEIAMGLETIHEPTLQKLNKQLNLDDFQRACEWLLARNISVRCFVLLRPPGMTREEGVEWCVRSVEYAQRLGVRHISIIPVRGGNGALENLRELGLFEPPSANCLEDALAQVIHLHGSVITADLWNFELLAGSTDEDSLSRRLRLEKANRYQQFGAV